MNARPLQIERLATLPYDAALMLQRQRHAAVLEGSQPDTLFLLQHPPVITLGRNAIATSLLSSAEALARARVSLVTTDRGGDATFHGPGQIVGYPIVALPEGERDVRKFVFRLEEIMIRTLADFDVQAERAEGRRGVWVGRDKIGAVGVRIARWVTMHGFALNVQVDLAYYRHLVPCGLSGFGVTSLHKLVSPVPALSDVEAAVARHAQEVLRVGAS